jgi:transcriptional regulator with XRE-family HTH domain
MGTRERPADRGRRRAREALARVVVDFRDARVASGLSLRAVGAALGVSHTHVHRFERGELRQASVEFVAASCAVVGLELGLRAYPAGGAPRDRAQLALLERFRARLHPSLAWRTEVPFPIVGDQRAWDAQTGTGEWLVNIDAETAIRDGQALERRLALKARDGGRGHVVLLVADTRTNRAAVALLRDGLRPLLPLDTRAVLAALGAGRDPGAGGIAIL